MRHRALRIVEQHDRRAGAAVPTIVAGNRPKEALLDVSPARIEHWRGGLVHKDTIGGGLMLAHVVDDRLEVEAGSSCPIAQRRTIQLDALTGIDLGLPVERQLISELRGDYVGNERLGRQAARYDMLSRIRLNYGARATATGVFRTACD